MKPPLRLSAAGAGAPHHNRAEDKFKGGKGVNSGQEWGPRGV